MKTKMFKLFSVVLILAMLIPTTVLAKPSPPNTETQTSTAETQTSSAEPTIYLIRLADAPLAAYQGELAGLNATSPKVTGERKLDVNTSDSQRYLSYLDNVQNSFISDLEALLGRDVEIVYQYQIANNGLAAKLTALEAEKVAAMSGVVFIQPDFERELHTDSSVEYVGAPTIWDGSSTGGLPGTYGEGMIIGVIDTGINPSNPSFADIGGDGYDHTNPWGSGVYTGVCDPGSSNYDATFPCNDKLIGAHGYAGNGDEARDYDGHGSHTASTAGGNIVDITDPVTATIMGMAPHANIIAYAACCSGSDLSAAIDDAIADGVDVINYSIGSASASDVWNDFDTVGYLNAREAGIFVATSAGNNGPDPETVGSPADAPWLTSVGNSLNIRVFVNSGEVTGPGTVPAELVGLGLMDGGAAPAITSVLEAGIVFAGDVEATNYDGCDPFPAGTFDEAIALVSRGDCTFATKETNAAAAGAAALIVYNHSAGPPIAMGGLAGTLPAYFMTDLDGAAVVAWIQSHTDPTFAIHPEVTKIVNTDWGDMIASGSSRGANRALPGIVKPDVAAPGTNILAAYGTDDAVEWSFLSGTSMASPHVAGAAALLMSLHPSWSPAEIQSALMTTAWSDMVKQDGVTPADPFDVGSGRIQVGSAAEAGLVLDESIQNYWDADPELGGDPQSLNLASVGNGSCVGTCTWERTVRSTLFVSQTWEVLVDVPPTITLEVSPMTFELGPGMEQTLAITANVSSATVDEWVFGSIVITPTTSLLAPTAPIFTEDFEGVFPPAGWTVVTNTALITGWQSTADTGYANLTYGSGLAADANSDALGGGVDTELWSPPINLTSATSPLLVYQSNFQDYAGDGDAWLDISTNGGTDWTNLTYWTADHGPTVEGVDLSSYAGQTVWLRWHYDDNGGWAWFWQIDDVVVTEAPEAPPAAHLPVAIRPAGSSLPDLVTIVTDMYTGTQVVPAVQVLNEITDLTTMSYGLAQADLAEDYLYEDPTNGDPYDDLDDTLWFTVDVPADALRLVAEIIKTTSPDLDLYVGTGDTPSGATQVAYSASGGSMEYVNINSPAEGTWWVLVHNWEGSDAQPDRVLMAAGVVDSTDAGNMTVTGPTAVPSGTPFDLDIEWDEPDMLGFDRWYGVFSLGTDAANPGNVGMVNVDVQFEDTRLTKMAPASAAVGDVFTYDLTIDTPGPISGTLVLTDVLPAGVEIVSGTITSTFGTAWYDAGDNAVYWNNSVVLALNSPDTPAVGSSSGPREGLTVHSVANEVSNDVQAPLAPNVDVAFVVDDGSAESFIGVNDGTDGTQFVWINRFTPASNEFPIVLDEIWAVFGATGINVGDAIDLLVYVDADGDGDPSNATHVATYNATVQAADQSTWNVYALSTPLMLTGPGDVLIGVINRYQPGTGIGLLDYPSARDTGPSQTRSYVGWWSVDAPADPPVWPPDALFGEIGGLGIPGNWLVRGYGESLVPDTIVVSFDVSVVGTGEIVNNAVLDDNGSLYPASATTNVAFYTIYLPLIPK